MGLNRKCRVHTGGLMGAKTDTECCCIHEGSMKDGDPAFCSTMRMVIPRYRKYREIGNYKSED